MYLRKIRPSTTCLYSAASMLLRSLSAVSQSLASKPRLAVPLPDALGLRVARAGAAGCATGSAPASDTLSLRPRPRITIPLATSAAFTSS